MEDHRRTTVGEVRRRAIRLLATLLVALPLTTSHADAAIEFGPPKLYPERAGAYPNSLAKGRFNRDRLPDLAWTECVFWACGSDTAVNVLRGGAGGEFSGSFRQYIANGDSHLLVSDLDHDSIDELVLARREGYLSDSLRGMVIQVFARSRGFEFEPVRVRRFRDHDSGYQLLGGFGAGDLNADGNEDLIAAFVDTNKLKVLTGKGDGSFRRPRTTALAAVPGYPEGYGVPNYPWARGAPARTIATGDFNGDGYDDLAMIGQSGRSNPPTATDLMAVLLSDGSGGFSAVRTMPVTDPWPWMVTARDLNGDGALDLALMVRNGAEIATFMGDGSGNFAPGPSYASNFALSIEIRDLNRDGNQDLAVGIRHGIQLFEGSSDGTLSPAGTIELEDIPHGYRRWDLRPTSIVAVDHDRDGAKDLVFVADARPDPDEPIDTYGWLGVIPGLPSDAAG